MGRVASGRHDPGLKYAEPQMGPASGTLRPQQAGLGDGSGTLLPETARIKGRYAYLRRDQGKKRFDPAMAAEDTANLGRNHVR